MTTEAEDKPNEGGWVFDEKKLNSETLMLLGRASAYLHLGQLFAQHAGKALDLRERGVLEKVVQTALKHHAENTALAINMAKKNGAVKWRPIAKRKMQ